MSRRTRPPRAVMWPVLLAILLAATSASNALAAPGDPPQRPRELRVMTYNIHHGAGNDSCTPPPRTTPPQPECALDLQRIADVIRAYDPDLVGLQEVDRYWARSGYVDQAAWLAAELGMHYCYGANLDHGPDSHATVPHQYGTAILSRYPILACENTLLPKADPRTEQRGLLEALVEVEGTPLRFYNTHLQHTGGPGGADRTVQVEAILEQIGRPRESVVLVGDLNARPDWPELAPLYERFEDAWLEAGSEPGYTYPASPTAEPDRRIDYVFVRRVGVESAQVAITPETRMAADHYPVVADLMLPGQVPGSP